MDEDGPLQIGLGQTRLSVIDLTDGGRQPMISSDDRYVLVFNGEIYNYLELRRKLEARGCSFRTSSDTEVLLQAWASWGEECLGALVGMFAFVVLDRQDLSLTCVRDAFGIKPLYFHTTASSFAFASEIPALETLLNRRFGANQASLLSYLALGTYDLGAETFFNEVTRLEAGHILHLKLSERTLAPQARRWWNPSIAEQRIPISTAAETVRQTFFESVRLHLRSDVPLGVALSGGVDSSSIACAIRYLEPQAPIKTFSFTAPGTSVNEEAWIDDVNDYIGAEPHKITISSAELSVDLDDMIRTQGEPFASSSIYAQYRVYRAAHEAGVTVMLDGQGADETFAGYSGYPEARFRSLLAHGDLVGLVRLMTAWSAYPGRSRMLALQHLGSALTPPSLKPWARQLVGKGLKSSLFESQALDFLSEIRMRTFQTRVDRISGRALSEQLRFALAEGPMNVLLRHGDRNSMRWSIESRVPFLSVPMAELALQLPEAYLMSPNGETKGILRAALAGIVPKHVLHRRDKVGFETPERNWLRDLGTQPGEWLEGLAIQPGINIDAARAYVRDSINGQQPYSSQTWRLINAGRWAQLFV